MPPTARRVIDTLYVAVALGFFGYVLFYYWTGLDGPILLAMTLVPVTFVLFVLGELKGEGLYPRLPPWANCAIATVYIGVCAVVCWYMHTEYEALGTVRSGFYNDADRIVGGAMALLIMEYARKRHAALFWLNILLILYAVYGKMVPGLFYHPGLSWARTIGALSVETTTGIFSDLPQLSLTLIGSFLLVLCILRAFGCVDSIVAATKRVAVRSSHALPQSAVVGSMVVGTIAGSGTANAITVGSATIPAMMGAGMPGATAAAIESASSLGGQILPPVMGVAAFLMAEFLGVSYFDVVARGWIPGFLYYATVSVSVYLLTARFRLSRPSFTAAGLTYIDWANIAAFTIAIAALTALMAIWYIAPMFAALYSFLAIALLLFVLHYGPMLMRGAGWREYVAPLSRFLHIYADMIADLTLLLATLSIMTGAMVITGVPTKIGALMIEAAGVNIVAMVLIAFCFGALLGLGLPPAPTYIIVVLVIGPPMIKAGVNPWVVHFFAFFLGLWGELTPPTSLVAAVTAKIANASFMRTMWRALQLCVCLFTLMAGVFARPALVIEPGLAQIEAALLIGIATIGITFAIQARFVEAPIPDAVLRLILGAVALLVLLHPSDAVSAAASLPVLGFIGYWVLRRRGTIAEKQQEMASS
jgi:TRAP transporter 4TM/12TM fusion protein